MGAIKFSQVYYNTRKGKRDRCFWLAIFFSGKIRNDPSAHTKKELAALKEICLCVKSVYDRIKAENGMVKLHGAYKRGGLLCQPN